MVALLFSIEVGILSIIFCYGRMDESRFREYMTRRRKRAKFPYPFPFVLMLLIRLLMDSTGPFEIR